MISGPSTPYETLEESNRTLTVDVANLASEKEELNNKLKHIQQKLEKIKEEEKQMKSLTVSYEKQIQVEKTLKIQMIEEESQVRLEMQMSLDSKDSDIERLRSQLTSLSIHSLDTTSISSIGNDLDSDEAYPVRITHSHTSESMSFTYQRSSKSVCIDTRPCRIAPRFSSDSDEEEDEEDEWRQTPALTYETPPDPEAAAAESGLEGWLSMPAKNTKRFGWDKKYVVVSSKKILF
ncbi:rho-associated protein kinase 2-like isoform X2 [Danio rerio]|uniref:Rho-associated protein kinase 2-like isoform X2 n=2 Tax=Danio rerio TaxID=7955 RepID=A0AC58I5M9_DANRE